MMDTVSTSASTNRRSKGLIEKTGNERFAWDSYRRFVQMYGDVVLGLKPQTKHESIRSSTSWTSMKHAKGVELDTELDADDLKELVKRVQESRQGTHRQGFPRRRLSTRCGAPSAPCSARG